LGKNKFWFTGREKKIFFSKKCLPKKVSEKNKNVVSQKCLKEKKCHPKKFRKKNGKNIFSKKKKLFKKKIPKLPDFKNEHFWFFPKINIGPPHGVF
jgi:hypothetical protein